MATCQVLAQSDSITHASPQSIVSVQPSESTAYTITAISITGNVRTKPSIILREVSLRPGSVVQISKADSVLKWEKDRIFNTNLFVTTNATLLATDSSNNRILHIQVHEQWYTIPQVYLEFADRNPNEWYFQRGADPRRVNAGIRLMQRNVRGRNETFRITVQGGFTNTYEIGYEKPFLDRQLKWGAGTFVSYSNNTSIATSTENHVLHFVTSQNLELVRNFYKATAQVYYRPKFFTKHSVEGTYNYNLIADTIARYNPDFFGNGVTRQQYAQIKYTFENDTRDRKQFAHTGRLLKLELEQLGLTPTDNVQLTRAIVTFNQYAKLSNRIYVATKLKGKVSTLGFQPFNEFKSLGFNENWARGFELYVVDGHHFFLNRNSLRYRLFSTIIDFKKWIPIRQFRVLPLDFYITLFGDWAYAYNANVTQTERFQNSLLTNRAHGSVGLGINLVSFYNSVLRFEYSYNSLGQMRYFFSMSTDI